MTRTLALLTVGLVSLGTRSGWAAGPPRPAPGEIADLAHQAAEDAVTVERLKTQLEVLGGVAGWPDMAGAPPGQPDALSSRPAEKLWRDVQAACLAFWEDNCGRLSDRLDEVRTQLAGSPPAALAAWQAARTDRCLREAELY